MTGLQLDKITFAEHFKANGYATAMYGKWHAGNYKPDLHPRYHGFDEAHVCRGHYDDSRSDPPLKLPGFGLAAVHDARLEGNPASTWLREQVVGVCTHAGIGTDHRFDARHFAGVTT